MKARLREIQQETGGGVPLDQADIVGRPPRRLGEVDVGTLSRDEESLISRPVMAQVRANLELQQIESEDIRDHLERRIKELLPPTLTWEFIEQYANAAARAFYYKRKREDMGFLK